VVTLHSALACIDDAGGSKLQIGVQPGRLEPSPASGIGVQVGGRSAAVVLQFLGAHVDSGVAVDADVDGLTGDAEQAPLAPGGFLLFLAARL
jgi:hypothetical protein